MAARCRVTRHGGQAIKPPKKIRLEASTICHLQCPSCPSGSGDASIAQGLGTLKLEPFRKLLEDNPSLRRVELSNCGNIFLNKDLLGIMECAAARGVKLTAESGVNLDQVPEAVLEGLVKHRFEVLTCSLDGATSDVHRIYRVGGDLDRALDNIRTINRHKRQYGSRRPRLIWQFVLFSHNEHQVGAARAMARRLGMDFRIKRAWDEAFGPKRYGDLIAEQRDRYADPARQAPPATADRRMSVFCHQMWEEPQINWDGRIMGCCCNHWGDFGGDVFADGLQASLENEKLAYARLMLLGKAPAREDIPCSRCAAYLLLRREGRWVKRGMSRRSFLVARRLYRGLKLYRVQHALRKRLPV